MSSRYFLVIDLPPLHQPHVCGSECFEQILCLGISICLVARFVLGLLGIWSLGRFRHACGVRFAEPRLAGGIALVNPPYIAFSIIVGHHRQVVACCVLPSSGCRVSIPPIVLYVASPCQHIRAGACQLGPYSPLASSLHDIKHTASSLNSSPQ